GTVARLPPAAAGPRTDRVERAVGRSPVQPGTGVGRVRPVQPVKVDEDLLRHVLRLLAVGQHPVGDPDHLRVLVPEEALESVHRWLNSTGGAGGYGLHNLQAPPSAAV